MKLATLFSIPKAFIGHSRIIQTNAIGSWERLKPEFEVLLCGQEDGVASTAHERRLEHIPELRKSEGGVPLLSDAFKAAHARMSHYKIYVNADIVFLSDLSRMLSSIGELGLKDFLIIGQRIDLNVVTPIDFESPDWEASLRERVKRDGRWAPVVCKDYFIFPASLYKIIPDFAVGRGNWDNWMVADSIRRGIAVVDATAVITAIHQNHDYVHVSGGKNAAYFAGPEAQRNRDLAGGKNIIKGSCATHALSWEGDRLILSKAGAGRFWKDLPRFCRLLKELFTRKENGN